MLDPLQLRADFPGAASGRPPQAAYGSPLLNWVLLAW
jgi:hypothetical protein